LRLTVPPDNRDTSAIPEHVPEDRLNESSELNVVASEPKPNWRSTASATAKLLLRGVRESTDAFGPLKSVAGGLCFILENYEVWPSSLIRYLRGLQESQRTKANQETIESLAPRVKVLAESLCEPVEDDVKEGARRQKFGQ
jgi:hypothetical protein